jgi:hypothetical protein
MDQGGCHHNMKQRHENNDECGQLSCINWLKMIVSFHTSQYISMITWNKMRIIRPVLGAKEDGSASLLRLKRIVFCTLGHTSTSYRSRRPLLNNSSKMTHFCNLGHFSYLYIIRLVNWSSRWSCHQWYDLTQQNEYKPLSIHMSPVLINKQKELMDSQLI